MNKKQKQLLKITLIVVFFISVLFNVVKCFRKSTILITNLPDKEIFFNSSGERIKISDPELGTTRQNLEPGIYVLYYDENPGERWYATIRIKKDTEDVKPKFRKQKLPTTHKKLILKDKAHTEDVEPGNKTWRYSIYNNRNNDINYNTEINFSLRGKRVEEEYSYTAKWWLDINGAEKSKEIITLTANETKIITVHGDKLHKIEVKIITSNNTATFEVNSILTKYILKN